MKIVAVILTSFLFSIACSSCGENQTQRHTMQDEPIDTQEKLIEQNIEYLKQERKDIESYIAQNNLKMQRTGSGLYYTALTTAPENVPNIADNDYIQYAFDLYLLDGTLLKSSEDDGNRNIYVGHDQVEIGLHEAFRLMKVGQRMLFIFPSHLAYGIAGNTDHVPPRTTVVFEIEPLKKLN